MKEQTVALKNYMAELDAFEAELTPEHYQIIDKVFELLGKTPPLRLIERIRQKYDSEYKSILRYYIPGLLNEAGVSSVNMEDGTAVKLDFKYTTKMLDKDRVVSWLEGHGYGDAVQDSLALPRGAFTDEVADALMSLGVQYERSSFVHPSRLKSIVVKHIEDGGDYPPIDALEIESFTEAKVKKPKSFSV